MNLPRLSVDPPSLEVIEDFFFIADASVTEEAKRVLNALAVAPSLEAVACVAGVAMVLLPGALASVAKARPRPELLVFDRQSRAFGFLKPANGETFAAVVRYATEFVNWVSDPDVLKAVRASEAHVEIVRNARRSA